MTITPEYIALVKRLLIYGTTQPFPSYGYYSSPFQFPTGIVVITDSGFRATASVASIVENGGELSITFTALFSQTFTASRLSLYAEYNGVLLYEIANIEGDFESSSDDPLSVEWDIDITVNDVFSFSCFFTSTNPSTVSSFITLNPPLLVYLYPYVVHMIIGYTLIPSIQFTIQSKFPNIPLSVMLSGIPQPTAPNQLLGITTLVVLQTPSPTNLKVIRTFVSNVSNGSGNVLVMSAPNEQSFIIGVYQIGNAYLGLMVEQITGITQGLTPLRFTFGVDVSI